jgi:branched-chain amino acid aminotransferase
MLASVDGAIGPAEEARIPVTDEGLTRGDGAFEVMRLYDGVPFALDAHLGRMAHTCAGLRLELDEPAGRGELAALLAAAGPVSGIVRVIITRGGRRVMTVEDLPARPDAARVGTVTYTPTRVLDGLKTISYAANMLASRLAREGGFDDALLVTPHGRVLEGPTWSFFWVAGGQLLTPPLEDRILPSITRTLVIEEAGGREAICTRDDLATAEEAFIASTTREVLPIAAIDELELRQVPGPVTTAVAERVRARIARELG